MKAEDIYITNKCKYTCRCGVFKYFLAIIMYFTTCSMIIIKDHNNNQTFAYSILSI